MTSERIMLVFRWIGALSVALVAAGFGSGCGGDTLKTPSVLVAPYDTSRGEALWGVAPLANETGDPSVPTDRVADALVHAAATTRGLGTLPLSRTIAAMNQLGLRSITSPAEAAAVARAMGVDGLVIGSVTAYDAYDPPRLGLNLALHVVGGVSGGSGLDIDGLRGRPTGSDEVRSGGVPGRPASTVVFLAEGRDQDVQMELRLFATGRHEENTALGWRRYLASMDLFTEFAAHAAVLRLLDEERLRLVRGASGRQQNRP